MVGAITDTAGKIESAERQWLCRQPARRCSLRLPEEEVVMFRESRFFGRTGAFLSTYTAFYRR